VASVAVELAERIFGELTNQRVMVLGAGDTSEKTVRSLKSQGVNSILVANRTFDRAAALASELGGEAIHWDQWEERAVEVDIMISSTSAPHFVLTHDRMEALRKKRRRQHSLFLIDLAVPRDFEPSIHKLDNVYLYDLDDLQSIASLHMSERQSEIQQSIRILQPHVERFLTWAANQSQDSVRT
jgi:glutamyl-tRNA reductase